MLMLAVVGTRLERELVGRQRCLSIAHFAALLPTLFPYTKQTGSTCKFFISLRVNPVGGTQRFIRILAPKTNLQNACFVVANF